MVYRWKKEKNPELVSANKKPTTHSGRGGAEFMKLTLYEMVNENFRAVGSRITLVDPYPITRYLFEPET